MIEFKYPKAKQGYRIWRGKHRATNQSYVVRRVNPKTKALLAWHSHEALEYAKGKLPPRYPLPAIRYDIEIMPNRVILWTKHNSQHWDMEYLVQDYSR